LQRVAACCSVLQRVAACCSVLQCVAVCCSQEDPSGKMAAFFCLLLYPIYIYEDAFGSMCVCVNAVVLYHVV